MGLNARKNNIISNTSPSVQVRPESAKIFGVTINNTRYADNTLMISEIDEQEQILMNILTAAAEWV